MNNTFAIFSTKLFNLTDTADLSYFYLDRQSFIFYGNGKNVPNFVRQFVIMDETLIDTMDQI